MSHKSLTQRTAVLSIKQLPVYQKALEVYLLTRNISHYFSESKSVLELYKSECSTEKALDTMTMTALSLPMQIAEAQSTVDFVKRMRYQESVKNAIDQLRKGYSNLKFKQSKHSEYLKLAIKELSNFKSLHNQWANVLTQKN